MKKIFSNRPVVISLFVILVASGFLYHSYRTSASMYQLAATPRFAPGETLNPNCAPTDPDCTVSVTHPPSTFIVSDYAARNALQGLQAGDDAITTSTNETWRYTQTGTWQKLSKTLLTNIYLVANLAARDALQGLQAGDVVVVSDINQTFAYTQTGTWQEFSLSHLADQYIVPDAAALNALTDLQSGDTASVTTLNKSYVWTRAGTWQEILAGTEDHTYVVTDIAGRDALIGINIGDHVVVIGQNKTYIRTQNNTWQELLASPNIVRLSNTYVVTDIATRDTLTGVQTGDIAIVTTLDKTYIYSQNNTWHQILAPASNQVLSVNSQTGAIVLNTDNIAEGGTSKYFTDTRARTAVLPLINGVNGQILTANGTGGVSWTTPAVAPTYSAGAGLTLVGTTFSLATPLSIANGGTGATTAIGARSSLGLAIGSNVEAWNSNLDTWAGKTAPAGLVVGTDDAQTLTNKTLGNEKLAVQIFSAAGTNDAVPEWDGSPVVELTGANILQTFNFGACNTSLGKTVTIYVRDTGNKARTINGTNTDLILPFTGGAKANYSMKNSAGGDVTAATFYCDGTDWIVISQSKR